MRSRFPLYAVCVCLLSLALVWAVSQPLAAAPDPAPAAPQATVTLVPFASGFSQPLAMAHAGDGSRRRFIAEKGGYIRLMQPGAGPHPLVLDIHTLVSTGNEQGLLGLAFHPNYDGVANRYFYVDYTDTAGNTVIARYETRADNPNVADPASAFTILTVTQPAANHNGGQLAFGPDGYLYIAMGDGGGANDPNNNGQRRDTLLGKILRIDVDHTSGGKNYAVPTGNPFVNSTATPTPRGEIWHYGLRNPWRFSFDRQTGEMWIGDVGQGSREEIDRVAAGVSGLNFGWRVYEGTSCSGNDPSLCSQSGFTPPVVDYDHSNGRCSVTGGYAYRGREGVFPAGRYVFGDYCSGEIWTLNGATMTPLTDTSFRIGAFGEDEAGELYVLDLSGGGVYRFANRNADTPGVFRPGNAAVFLRNSNTTGGADLAFSYGAAGDTPLVGDWNGDRVKTIGVFRGGAFFLRNANSTGPSELAFNFGLASDRPVVGDWDGDGTDTVGVFRNGVFYLRNSNSAGSPDLAFTYGAAGDIPVVGDWNGDGRDEIGVYRNGAFYLRNSLTTGPADLIFNYGTSGDVPVVGDWNADTVDTVGVFRNGAFYLRNTNDTGGSNTAFSYGAANDVPLVGDWDGQP